MLDNGSEQEQALASTIQDLLTDRGFETSKVSGKVFLVRMPNSWGPCEDANKEILEVNLVGNIDPGAWDIINE